MNKQQLQEFYQNLRGLPAPVYDDGNGRVLFQGDSLQLLERLPPRSIDLVFTDPPYSSGGQYRGDRAQSTSVKYRLTGTVKANPEFAGDTRDQRSFERWTVAWSSAAYHATRPGGALICFSDWRQLGATYDAVQVGGWLSRGIMAWDKTEGTRPQLGWFRQQVEFMVTASRGPLSRGKPTDGVASPGVFRFFMNGRDKVHTTEKPVAMLEKIIATRPDWQTVCDPFAGSASTLIAARRVDRCAIAFELDPAVIAETLEHLRSLDAENSDATRSAA